MAINNYVSHLAVSFIKSSGGNGIDCRVYKEVTPKITRENSVRTTISGARLYTSCLMIVYYAVPVQFTFQPIDSEKCLLNTSQVN